MQSPGSQAGVAPVAPEHVNRLLVAMSPEGVFFSFDDLCAFVGKHALPFSEDLLHHMFAEANSSADGLMDVEQLGKATSFKFHNRQYNAEWARLCDLAPRAAGSRVTALSPRALEQEPIRANFEQEPQILTFSPLINERPGGLGATREFNMTASAASYSSGPRTLSSQGVFNTAHSLPPAAGRVPNVAADRAEEDKINRRMRPEAHTRAPAPAPAPPPAGVQVASFDTPGGPPLRCGFDTCAAFDRSVEALQRVSDGVGWRIKGKAAVAAADAAATPPPLLNGLHERDWLYLPGGKADHIPMRIDGQVGRETGVPATTALRLLACENSRHGLANSRRHHQAEYPARAGGGEGEPFRTVFPQASIFDRELKKSAASDRLEAARGIEYPRPIAYLNGKPSAYDFRPQNLEEDRHLPKFITDTLGCALVPRLARATAQRTPSPARERQHMWTAPLCRRVRSHRRHWPVREGMPVSALRQANPPLSCAPLRLALTENLHPASRAKW